MPYKIIGVLGLGAMAAFVACSSDDEPSSGSGGSAGAGATSGSGGVEAGSGGTGGAGASGGTGGVGGVSDPCSATEVNAASTVGCNGAKPGPQADNALGGACTPDGIDGPGTCADAAHYCDYYEVAWGGICVVECVPGASYVSTGGCPSGFRCYDFGGTALCYPDCASAADCGTGFCDEDFACSSPFDGPDGGGPDAGDDASVMDAGAGD